MTKGALADDGLDCGMKYLARDVAFGKLAALAAGAAIVRRELA
jgi:5-methyltetrahydropteroyltriglutamate--homocysteine methyltransferase